MNIIGPRYPLKQFSYDPIQRQLIGELSDLGRPGLGQLFDDACDEGLVVDSPTGKSVAFYVDHETHDNEGDLVALHLKPYRAEGKLASLTMVLFND